MPLDASVKFTVLKVRNESGRARRLSATGYVEWVLGDLRPKSRMHVITKVDPNTGALFALNPYNTEFADRTAFFDVADATRTVSGDRTEFIGRNGTLRSPAAMTQSRLSGRVGAALDPCAAIQVPFDLADGQEREIVFILGAGRDRDEAGNLVRRFRGPAAARGALDTGLAVLEPHSRRSERGNTRPVRQLPGQRLALIPNARMSSLGAERILPVRGRLRVPRPVAGRNGAYPHRAAPRARTPPPLRGPSVPGGRCPALVASSVRQGRAHTLFGRLPLVAVGYVPIRSEHR